MASPPVTGDMELDAYLYSLQIELDNSATTTTTTTVSSYTGLNSAYYTQKYIHILYADNEVGSNLSTVSTNRLYYGVHNSNYTTASENPADYTWFKVTDGFTTGKNLYYTVTFGRNLNLYIAEVAPASAWAIVPEDYIDLDLVTDGLVNSTSFEADYQPIYIVATLPPNTGYVGPYLVYVTTEGKLYRYVSGNWVKETLTSDLLGTISETQLADNSVSEDKIVDDAVTTVKILDGAVTEDKLDTDAVTTTKIADGSVTRTAESSTNSITLSVVGGYPLFVSTMSDWTGTASGNTNGASITVTLDDTGGDTYTQVLPPVYKATGMTYGAGTTTGVLTPSNTGTVTATAVVTNGDPITRMIAFQLIK